MRPHPFILLVFLVSVTGTLKSQEPVADSAFRVTDFVDVPGAWTGEADSGWYLEFREQWIIDPDRSMILKKVEDYRPFNKSLPDVSPDSLKALFASMIRKQFPAGGKISARGISYEFILLDPHLESSGNGFYPSPDSMDRGTKALQQALISLVRRRSQLGSMLDLEEQLLSVQFHEDWYLDPVSLKLTREVLAITPVIWQRRRTVQGEPVDEPDTGYPVYYKSLLERIGLRNP
jgi:hypothetical protein